LIDVMEAVLGDMPSQGDRSRPDVRARPDGTWLADAMVEIERVEQALPGFRSDDPGNRDYQTLAGYLVKRLGRVPREGETVEAGGYIFEILDMDSHRVDKVLVTKSSGLA
jgi:putative hemolysin